MVTNIKNIQFYLLIGITGKGIFYYYSLSVSFLYEIWSDKLQSLMIYFLNKKKDKVIYKINNMCYIAILTCILERTFYQNDQFKYIKQNVNRYFPL